jgi:hypothetical protein
MAMELFTGKDPALADGHAPEAIYGAPDGTPLGRLVRMAGMIAGKRQIGIPSPARSSTTTSSSERRRHGVDLGKRAGRPTNVVFSER